MGVRGKQEVPFFDMGAGRGKTEFDGVSTSTSHMIMKCLLIIQRNGDTKYITETSPEMQG